MSNVFNVYALVTILTIPKLKNEKDGEKTHARDRINVILKRTMNDESEKRAKYLA